FKEKEEKQKPEEVAQRTFSLSENSRNKENEFSAKIESVDDITIYPETSGLLKQVLVKEGQEVKKGKVLARLENVNQRLAVKNAQIRLDSARIQLKKMQNNNKLSDKNSTLSRIIDTQKSNIKSLKNAYINTDLKAYTDDYNDDDVAPTISGNYHCEAEGEYIIDIYKSNTDSGASMRISGLETSRASVSTEYPVPFGSCGLEIVFPKGFDRNKDWTIPVPNTRSSQYVSAKNNYNSAQAGKSLAVKQGTIAPEDISHQKKLISQSLLSLEVSQIALSKTYIKAPFNGLIYKKNIDAGRLVSPSVGIFDMSSPELELVSYLSISQSRDLVVGQEVDIHIEDVIYKGEISSIIKSSHDGSQNLKVSFTFTDEIELELIPGTVAKIVAKNIQNQLYIESDFVGFGYDGPFINCSNKSILIDIQDEDKDGYWINKSNAICNDVINLPHLITGQYE
ncbi:MAG: biotin/lipoyl-binding protein, partial [Candidatus Pacebacteria bacterium]|nr:biotin/lipoyl-binding protein [Candidatus Paceibacterota bacterium]